MSTYTQILYQIVYSTWKRESTLNNDNRDEIYRYIGGILKGKKCHLYCIGGVSDHIHILTHLHPAISLASLVKDIKLASTELIKCKNLFPHFSGWQEGYAAFTYTIKARNGLIDYIKIRKHTIM